MIRIEHEVVRYEIMAPMLMASDNGIEFLIIHAILSMALIELFTKIRDRSVLL
ncbi:hypothetical protein HanIR_Chr09g0399891 [Helianthus annuus]|nr:hypothetical protein HanIR_Chr09g0399891 [Helianthus annuus]